MIDSMSPKAMRARCEARLSTLDLPDPFSPEAFCRTLSEERHRPIILHPLHIGGGLYGAWVPTATTDLIFFEQDTSVLHQQHICLHELSHLICGHESEAAADARFASLLFPHLDPDAVRRMLKRAAHSSDQELEAETLASLIWRKTHRYTVSTDVAPLVGRLEHTLE